MIMAKFHHVELPPPPHERNAHTQISHIQTDIDYTKRVETILRDHTLKIHSPRIRSNRISGKVDV